MLTKQDILDQMLTEKKPRCPHCNQEMSIWEVPDLNVGDGLGWGTPYLYMCFNDECPSYKRGWEHMEENYAHRASYRCMCYPSDKTNFQFIPVFSPMGGTGQIVDNDAVEAKKQLEEAIKIGFRTLAECYVSKDEEAIMHILLDAVQPQRVRKKAAEMIGDMSGIEALDALKSSKFGNPLVQEEVSKSIKKIHDRTFTRECPFCAEIIKKRANVCKHCGKDVAGL
jgi:hypothetical protein